MSRLALSTALIALASCLLPEAAAACSVCNGGAEENRQAFLFTTVLLSILPVAMLGTLGWWVWRCNREAEAPGAPPIAEPIPELPAPTGAPATPLV
jgi:nitrate reductase NapE component